jgi:hypothetical protein
VQNTRRYDGRELDIDSPATSRYGVESAADEPIASGGDDRARAQPSGVLHHDNDVPFSEDTIHSLTLMLSGLTCWRETCAKLRVSCLRSKDRTLLRCTPSRENLEMVLPEPERRFPSSTTELACLARGLQRRMLGADNCRGLFIRVGSLHACARSNLVAHISTRPTAAAPGRFRACTTGKYGRNDHQQR